MAKVTNIGDLRARSIADENRQLKQQLGAIHQRLHDNEQLFARLTAIESAVLQSDNPAALCLQLRTLLQEEFSLDLVQFWLDQEGCLADCGLDAISLRYLRWVAPKALRELDLARHSVRLVDLAVEEVALLAAEDSHISSLALLRLGSATQPLGVLVLGAAMRDRFSPDKGTELLQHLALMIGLSLEHGVTRDQLIRRSVRDAVTGCYNRRFLQPLSRHALAQWFGDLAPVSLCCIDAMAADGKAVPGVELHAALAPSVRRSDPLVRMDDEQFALFLAGCDGDKAAALAQKIVAAVSKVLAGASVHIGVACEVDVAHTEVRDLIDRGEQAMYIARALGGSRVEIEAGRDPDGEAL
ncbi:MAG: DUF484 family protein [Mariprofundales bacterium]|nr:DUF484 family protein [Mariprofundales bacterium]